MKVRKIVGIVLTVLFVGLAVSSCDVLTFPTADLKGKVRSLGNADEVWAGPIRYNGTYYQTLTEAFADVPNKEKGDVALLPLQKIEVTGEHVVNAIIQTPFQSNVLLVVPAGKSATFVRGNTYYGQLFEVSRNSKLTIKGDFTVDGKKTELGNPSRTVGELISVYGLSGSYSSSSRAGILVIEDGVALINNYIRAVNVDVKASFTMNGGTISNSGRYDQIGGGIAVDRASFTMNGGTIKNNEAFMGGGVSVMGDPLSDTRRGTFTLNDGTISGNSAQKEGKGVFLSLCDYELNSAIDDDIAISDTGWGPDGYTIIPGKAQQ